VSASLEQTLDVAFRAEGRALFGIAYRITGSASEAEDVVQETFVRALAHPPADRDASLRPWLTRIAVNLARDALRRRRSRKYFGPWLPEPLEDGAKLEVLGIESAADLAPSPEARFSLSESASYAFLCALEALGPRERTVIVLRDVVGLDAEETAAILGTTAGNVRVVHHRARAKLRVSEDAPRTTDEALRERTMRALGALVAAIGSGDVAAVASLLSHDCVLETDAAGEFHAAVVRVEGRERIALTQVSIAGHLVIRDARIASVNGLPAVVLDIVPERARQAPRSVLLIELDDQGLIRAIRSVLASAKLAHLSA